MRPLLKYIAESLTFLQQGRFTIIKDCAVILDDSIVAPGTVVPSMTIFRGSPAKLVEDLPESYPEILEAAARSYYADFKPAQ